MKIGEIVKKYREEHGLSMRQFAKLSGLSHAYIPLIERGTNHNGEPLIQVQSLRSKNGRVCAQFTQITARFLLDFNQNSDKNHAPPRAIPRPSAS